MLENFSLTVQPLTGSRVLETDQPVICRLPKVSQISALEAFSRSPAISFFASLQHTLHFLLVLIVSSTLAWNTHLHITNVTPPSYLWPDGHFLYGFPLSDRKLLHLRGCYHHRGVPRLHWHVKARHAGLYWSHLPRIQDLSGSPSAIVKRQYLLKVCMHW